MHTLEATDRQLARVREMPADEPVVMVNLVKFRAESLDGDGSGWDAYRRYSAAVIKLIKARGGDILWAGTAAGAALGPEHDGDWDYVVLVRYPTPGAFVDMMTSADYAKANRHRLNGLARHAIIASRQQFGRFAEAADG